MPDRQKIRVNLNARLRQIIEEQKITLIAEEAGDDTAVWEQLKKEDELVGELGDIFGPGSKTVDRPVPTIAKGIACERSVQIRHLDIRADANAMPSVEQRDEYMVTKIRENFGTAENVLVIVGEDHRAGVSERLSREGSSVESFGFPEP